MKRPLLLLASVGLLGLSLGFAQLLQQNGPVSVEVAQLTTENVGRFVPEGKEVDAIYGDYVLRNGLITAVIAQPLATRHANMTTKDVAGGLIDLTLRDAPSDQLTAFYPGKKSYAYRHAEVAVAKGRAAFQPVDQLPAAGAQASVASITVVAEATAEKPEARTAYVLYSGTDHLLVNTVYTNRGQQPLTITLEDDFRADGGKEDMPRTPNGTVDAFWLHDRHWGQAYGIDSKGRKLQVNSDAKTTQIKYVDAAGEATVKLAPGESTTLVRRIYPGRDVLQVHASHQRQTGASPQKVNLHLHAKGAPIPEARVEIFRGEASIGLGRTAADGVLQTELLPGDYTLQATRFGQSLSEKPWPFSVKDGANELDFSLPGDHFGSVHGTITDAAGGPLPCKIEFKPQDPELKLDFGPETGEFAVRNLVYAPLGSFRQDLPAGKYDVVVSHGPEFDILKTTLVVPFDGIAKLEGKLARPVETKGWVSSDFHSHASPSGDNTSSQLGRVLNLVCEHIEFAPCTEHNRVSTYQPHIDRLKIGKYLASVEGMELTGSPLPLNHQNTFPMKYKPFEQDGGGPTTATNLEDQIERLALWDDRSEKLLQVNHPDLGWMFYDKDGDGKPDGGHSRAFPFMDVIEIHPVEHALDLAPFVTMRGGRRFHNTVFRWLQLLNQGYRIYGVVNTDAHYNFHGSGYLRNWIQSPTDNPAEINPLDMVHAAEQGRLVMSNGPFLEVWATETGKTARVTAGQDLAASSKKVTLHVNAQCPNWLDLDRCFVLVNGRIHPQHNYFREQHPHMFRSGAVKIDQQLELTLERDAHVIVVVGDLGADLSQVYATADGKATPTAFINPIFIDVDGNGFEASKDTLDAPLPVKFEATK